MRSADDASVSIGFLDSDSRGSLAALDARL